MSEISECSRGLASYVRSLALYELSDEGKNLLLDLVDNALARMVMYDESFRIRIEEFFSGDPDILEKGDFFKELFKTIIKSKEFKDSIKREIGRKDAD